MSATSGAISNKAKLTTQAGLTTTQAQSLSGADLMREALRVKAGLSAAQIATLDGARLAQLAGTMPDLGAQ